MEKTLLKINDRVKRKDAIGCLGNILDIREELIATRGDSKNKALLCKVRWDDGVQSYYEITALVKA